MKSKIRSFGDANSSMAHVRRRGHLSTAAFCLFWSGTACLAYGAPGDTQLISVSTITNKAAGYSGNAPGASISYGGRYVAFESNAKNLIPGPSSQFRDIYVRDRNTSSTERVTVALNGAQTNGDSLDPSISADGRYVAFASYASNLAPDSYPGRSGLDIFVRDRLNGQTELVSVNSSGQQADQSSQAPVISSSGRYVVFDSYATNIGPGINNGWANIYVHDRQTGLTEWLSVGVHGAQPNNQSWNNGGPRAISADGRYVVFSSDATNLVAGDTNGATDIFLRDRQAGTTERVSVDSNGVQGNGPAGNAAISADGRYVMFTSDANNLAPGDTNGVGDIFIRDRQTGKTERINVDSVIAQSSFGAQISDDERRCPLHRF